MTMNAHHDFLLGRFAKAATLALGFGTVWTVVILWTVTTIVNSRVGGEPRRMESLRVTRDGTPVVESYPIDDYSRATVRDLEGRELDARSPRGDIQPSFLSGEPRSWPAALFGPRWSSRIKPFSNERDPKAIWYFVRNADPKGAGAFVGYERGSNRLLGYIGLAGFRTSPVPADERIPVPLQDVSIGTQWSSEPVSVWSSTVTPRLIEPTDVPPRRVHVPSGNVLRVVDLDEGTVRTVFESAEPIVAAAVPYLFSYFGQAEDRERDSGRSILVRTPTRVFRLDHDYKVVGTFEIPPEVGPERALYWYETRDGSAVVTCYVPPPGATAFDSVGQREMVYQLAADGAIRKSTPVALNNGASGVSGRTALVFMALGAPAPLPALAVDAVGAINDPYRDFPAALASILTASLPVLAAVGLLALALAAATWRRGRAFGTPTRERTAWTVFVALFGLPGWVGFRLHRAWPARATCPRCGARAPRDRESCVACGEPFPEPAATGTEIFA
mgnify:CR=1 FL=1